MDKFLTAIVPEPFTILGRRLEPLALGHLLFLQRFGCDPVLTLDQLITAVLICSHPVAEVLPCFGDPWLRLKVGVWGFRLRWRWPGSKRSDPLARFQRALVLWREYLEAHLGAGPQVTSEEGGSSLPGAPWFQHLRVTLMSKLGYSPAEALAAPYGLALWDYYTFYENEGRIEIFGEGQLALHAEANAMEAAIKEAARQWT